MAQLAVVPKRQDPITITLIQCAEAEVALRRFAALPAPPKLAYKVAKALKAVHEEAQHFYEKRETLIRQFGAERDSLAVERAQGHPERVFEVPPEKRETYFRALQEEGNVEAVLHVTRFSLEELSLLSTMTGEDLLRLGPLLEDDSELPPSSS